MDIKDRVVERFLNNEWVQESILLTLKEARYHVAFEARHHPEMQLRITFIGLA